MPPVVLMSVQIWVKVKYSCLLNEGWEVAIVFISCGGTCISEGKMGRKSSILTSSGDFEVGRVRVKVGVRVGVKVGVKVGVWVRV